MERNILIPEQSSYPLAEENGWTKENQDTIKTWQDDIRKSVFIYQSYLDNTSRNLNISLTISLIVGALMTLSNILNVLLGILGIRWVSLGFSSFSFICGAIITIITGLIKLNGWENRILVLSKYIQVLESAWFVIYKELTKTTDRQNARDFIERTGEEYLFLMRSGPPLDFKNYEIFNMKYQTFVNDKIEEITV